MLYEILTPKNKMDISTFAKHMTEQEFHMISYTNKDSGATGAFENYVNVATQYTNFLYNHTCPQLSCL